MNAPTRSPASAKAPATFARMLVLAQRRFDAQRRPPPAAGVASIAAPVAALRRSTSRTRVLRTAGA